MFGVGDVVRKLRQERGWSLDDLAAKSGVNRMTLSALERGGTDHRSSTLDSIGRAFGFGGSAELYALVPPRREVTGSLGAFRDAEPVTSPVTDVREVQGHDEELLDVSGYERFSIPVIAEGDASPEGVFWDSETGVKLIEAEEWMSRPNDPAVKDPRCYGVKVRGDSMEPLLKPGMRVIVSPNLAVEDGGLSYVQLTSGERLIKVIHKHPAGFTLESFNRAYAPRFVAREEVKAVHRIAYIRTLK